MDNKYDLIELAARAVDFAVHFANAASEYLNVATVKPISHDGATFYYSEISIPVNLYGRATQITDSVTSILRRLRDGGIIDSSDLPEDEELDKVVKRAINDSVTSKTWAKQGSDIVLGDNVRIIKGQPNQLVINVHKTPAVIADTLNRQGIPEFMTVEVKRTMEIVEENTTKRQQMALDAVG